MMIKSKLPKLKFAIFGFLVLLLALSPVTSVFAQGLGHGFYGTVKIGGEDAEIGTAISARVDGTEYGSCQVATLGQYALIVQGEIEDSATIDFYINDQEGGQTFLFHDGWTTKLDLTIDKIAPSVATGVASVTTTSATLNGSLDDLGTALSVDVSFEWGRTTAYDNTATVTASPLSTPGAFSATLTGLSASTSYHFIAVAVGDGTGYGVDTTFTTSAAPEPEPEPAVGGGGGGGPAPPPPGTTDVRGMVSTAGRFWYPVTAMSEDRLCRLSIPRGTVGLTEELEPLDEITMLIMDDPPPPPEDAHVIGLGYDFQPSGATFDPAITLTFSYDPADIPEGIAEEDLVIAYYVAGEWVELEGCVVDTENDTITASVNHFTTFAIVGAVMPPPPLAPAAFSVTGFSIQPVEVEPNETVTIRLSVANTGGTEGSYSVILKINGVKEVEKSVTVAAGSSEIVTFSVTREESDSYSVVVDGLSGSFTVVAPPPPLVPVPAPAPPPAKPINWPLIGGIIGGVIVVGLGIFFLVRRRRAY